MLKKIATENHVQAVVGKIPSGRAVLLKKFDFWIELALGNRVEIHRILSGADDVVDELPVSTAQVQNGGVGRNARLKPALN
jgi:hypothetical protein